MARKKKKTPARAPVVRSVKPEQADRYKDYKVYWGNGLKTIVSGNHLRRNPAVFSGLRILPV